MTYFSIAENLAADIKSSQYAPTRLNSCESLLTADRNPQVVRLTEFTLFIKDKSEKITPPRYLVLQPQYLLPREVAQKLEASYRAEHVDPFIKGWKASVLTASLPPAHARNIDHVREAIREMAATQNNGRHGLPNWNLPDKLLRERYAQWHRTATELLVLERFERISAGVGSDVALPARANRLDADDLAAAIMNLEFPIAFQSHKSPHTIVALCTSYDQIWDPAGYTRGELIGSMSLAPGERLTIEVHSWDKSSRRTEDDLAVESEMRTSEKITQRDSLTVLQEYAQQQSTKVEAGGTIPIPQLPLTLGVQDQVDAQSRLNRTTERLREGVVEASSTLKINRKMHIESSREIGREEKQTRVLENTNRCHSLNFHYFEVIANYLVTTQAAAVQVCALIRNPRNSFTLEFILCHEGILRRSLLDRIFLPGFDAAKTLMVQAKLEELEMRQRLAQLEVTGSQLTPHALAIVDAYQVLADAQNAFEDAVQVVGAGKPWSVMDRLTPLQIEQVNSWYALSAVAHNALDRLANDLEADRNAAEAIRAFLAVAGAQVPPRDRFDVYSDINTRLGSFSGSLRWGVNDDLLQYDDAGLRAAVRVASDSIRSLTPQVPAEIDLTSNQEIAVAEVEFGRLQCHLEENWIHYNQAIWSREDHGQRFRRLQSYGPISNVIENRLLGFHGDRAAYPLRDLTAVTGADIEGIRAAVAKGIEAAQGKPVLVSVPTSGQVLEAVVGQCDACEEYIQKNRLVDLKLQTAKAMQEEAEEERLRSRVAAGDLSNPGPASANLVVELIQHGDADSDDQ
ncbi:hypothetical protein AB0H92_49335 [Streptomyces phaeochromogenes]|uniref:hypothetical protein n=1 Tax=Streptomyces phaeochromogenes TaxID=1923 RepID=UPI0033C01CF3